VHDADMEIWREPGEGSGVHLPASRQGATVRIQIPEPFGRPSKRKGVTYGRNHFFRGVAIRFR